VPLRKIVDAGYVSVFANPTGEEPKLDYCANNARFLVETTASERRL